MDNPTYPDNMFAYADGYRKGHEDGKTRGCAEETKELLTEAKKVQIQAEFDRKVINNLASHPSPNPEYIVKRPESHQCAEVPQCPVMPPPTVVDVPTILTNAIVNASQHVFEGVVALPWSLMLVVIGGVIPSVLAFSDDVFNWARSMAIVRDWQYCDTCRCKVRKGMKAILGTKVQRENLDRGLLRTAVEVILSDGECVECYAKAIGSEENYITNAKKLIKKWKEAKKSKRAAETDRMIGGGKKHSKKASWPEKNSDAESILDRDPLEESMEEEQSGWTMADAVDGQSDDSDYDMLEDEEFSEA